MSGALAVVDGMVDTGLVSQFGVVSFATSKYKLIIILNYYFEYEKVTFGAKKKINKGKKLSKMRFRLITKL